MSTTRDGRLQKTVLVAALAVGVAAGSYGIASAASGASGSGSNSTAPPATAPSGDPAPHGHGGRGSERPCGGRRGDEARLTGVTASKVEAAAKAKVVGGTIVRVETDADGHAAYEAHMTDADGAPVTVYVDRDFGVVSVERR